MVLKNAKAIWKIGLSNDFFWRFSIFRKNNFILIPGGRVNKQLAGSWFIFWPDPDSMNMDTKHWAEAITVFIQGGPYRAIDGGGQW